MRLPAVIGIGLVVAYLLISPRFSHLIFSFSRHSSLRTLITQTQSARHLDAQKFWETREFYYPGVLHVYADGLNADDLTAFENKSGLKLKPADSFTILTFDSPKWQSYEALVNTNIFENYLDLPTTTPLYQDEETRIYEDNGKTLIFFLKSYPELQVTNGFVYRSQEILDKYRYWLGVSVVTR